MRPQERIVELQIGRPPRGMERVEARCAWGYPTVVSVRALVPHRRGRGEPEPFPTLFWLTCPVLVEQISRLEASGMVGRIEDRIAADPGLASRVRADHARYAAERYAAMDGAARAEADRRGLAAVLRDAGVGGCREVAHVKCLHAHYAHHLARGGNAVGGIVDEGSRPAECAAGEVRCDAFGVKPGA